MGRLTRAANRVWWIAAERHRSAWLRASNDPKRAQSQVLAGILRRNRSSDFGKDHSFGSTTSPRRFAERVPLSDYEDYAGAMQGIGDGAQGLLTTEPVRLIQPSSGSAAACKWIPYTRSLQREFSRAIAVWVSQLFRTHPGAAAGPAYWSVTPLATPVDGPDAVRYGFEDDSAYLGGVFSPLVRSVMAVPSDVRYLKALDSCRYVSLFHLLRTPDLALMSVWSPTFLELLLSRLSEWGEGLAQDVARGRPRPPGLIGEVAGRRSSEPVRPLPGRSIEILEALREKDLGAMHSRLWPRLAVVSAWADGPSRPFADRLRTLLPQAHFQAKGLVATEGITSVPFEGGSSEGSVLALTSHFLEFVPDGEETVFGADELELGGRYQVVLTTGGGLYRYRTGDLIEVVGFFNRCPRVRFVGRADLVADWFGEKLSEPHVREVVSKVLESMNRSLRFALLACEEREPPTYVLHLECGAADRDLATLSLGIEDGLAENPHYAYCRSLGQLGPVAVHRVSNGWDHYIERRHLEGQREGDVKPAWLSCESGWCVTFGCKL